MKRFTGFLQVAALLLGAFLTPVPALAAADEVGKISRLRGNAFLRGFSHFKIARVGTSLEAGDRILTGRYSRVELTMIDGSKIMLGDNTDFTVKSYEYKPSEGVGRAVFGFVKGAFRAITAGIGRMNNPDFRVQTPVATMGVRGTTFWGGLQFFDDQLHVALLEGKGVYLETDVGRTEIRNVGYGSTVRKGGSPTQPKPWDAQKVSTAVASVTW